MKRPDLLLQPRPSKLCGQTCLAMLLGVTIGDAVRMVGHSKGTAALKMIEILQRAGIKTACDVCRIDKDGLPELAIVLIRWRKGGRKKHWCIKWKNEYLCPWYGVSHGLPKSEHLATGAIAIGYIPIYE